MRYQVRLFESYSLGPINPHRLPKSEWDDPVKARQQADHENMASDVYTYGVWDGAKKKWVRQ